MGTIIAISNQKGGVSKSFALSEAWQKSSACGY